MNEIDYPYPPSGDEAFEMWLRENGYEDLADCPPDGVDLYRLRGAADVYRELKSRDGGKCQRCSEPVAKTADPLCRFCSGHLEMKG